MGELTGDLKALADEQKSAIVSGWVDGGNWRRSTLSI